MKKIDRLLTKVQAHIQPKGEEIPYDLLTVEQLRELADGEPSEERIIEIFDSVGYDIRTVIGWTQENTD